MDTLVLSHTYMPIDRICWQDAISMVVTGRVEVIEAYEDRVIRTVSEVFQMPSVVRFVKKVAGYFKRGVKFNRKSVWLRDKGGCQYCGNKVSMSEFTYDHVIPLSQKGKTAWDNIVVCCMPCNQKKRDRTPEQAKMRLLSVPAVPKTLPTVDIFGHGWGDPSTMPASWKDYFGSIKYWLTPMA